MAGKQFRYLLLLIALIALGQNLRSQSGECTNPDFELVFSGPDKNITIDCGWILNSAIWKVRNDTCKMTVDTIWLSQGNCSGSGNLVEVNIRMDREGNQVDSDDFIVIQISCETTLLVNDTIWGDWVPDLGQSNVRTNSYDISCSYPGYVIVEIIMGSNSNQAHMKILKGNTCTNCYTPTVLPISLKRISGKYKNKAVDINFELFSSNIIDGILILERSNDGKTYHEANSIGINLFEGIDTTFTVSDDNPFDGFYYYRIRILSQNGKTMIVSDVIKVDFANSIEFSMYPNPVRPGSWVTIKNVTDIQSISIFSVSGKLIELKEIESIQNNMNNLEFKLPEFIDPGFYRMIVISDKNQLQTMLMVQ